MSKPRVVLLNPPGKRVYLRDYYCSKVSQADYINAPIDLLFASGWLRGSAGLELIDAIVQSLDPRRCIERISGYDPDWIVGLIGAASYSEDVHFYRRLASSVSARIVLSGDVLLERPVERLKRMPWATALLHDFSSPALLRFLQGCRDPDLLTGLTYRGGGSGSAGIGEKSSRTTIEMPPPDHHLFLSHPYRYPFVRRARFATVLTDFGCPYRCGFCVMPGLGWKLRSLQGIQQELQELSRLGVRELFFLDQTFGLRRQRCRPLLNSLSEGDFGWVCFNRPDLMDREWALELASAGCHTIILGLESGNDKILRSAQKDYSRDQILEGFTNCREAGLRTVATLILGLPEESDATFEETLGFLEEVNPDYASINVAVPRATTPLRRRALRLGLVEEGFDEMDQSGNPVAMPSLNLSREQIAGLKSAALRRFYFRPDYLVGRLRSLLRSGAGYPWVVQIRQALALLRSAVG